MEQEPNTNSQSEQAPLGNMLSSLLSNPEMMEKIKAIAGQMSTAAEPKEEENAQDALPVSAPSVPPADGLASVLANPELMAKLPQIMSMMGPMLSAGGNLSSKPAQPPHKKTSEDYRNDLLLALKPFLSPERCRAVDTMLRISKLGTVIRQIK